MYKLVCCDVDGTLLKPGETELQPRLFMQINNLCNMGVEFVVASGRPYYELVRLFGPVSSLLTFICCDGAVIVRNGRILFEMPLSVDIVRQLAAADPDRLLYGLNGVYKDIASVHGNIYKVCLKKDAADKHFPESVYIGYEGDGLTEFLSVGADKGVALTFLQKKLRISPDRCVAFGDNRNDVWMLRSVGCAYAMKNAKCDMSDTAQHVTDNVSGTLDELFFNKRGRL